MSNGNQSLDKNLRTLNKYSRADVVENDFRNFATDFRKNVTRIFLLQYEEKYRVGYKNTKVTTKKRDKGY
jgi:hypothetical protein